MNPSEFRLVGKITHAHGLRGDLFVHLFAKKADWLEKCDDLFLADVSEISDRKFAPQQAVIKECKLHKGGLLIKLDGIGDRTRADELLKKFVFIKVETLVSSPGEMLFLQEVLGFGVTDNGQEVGVIVAFSSNGPQDLLVIESKRSGKAFEVPFVEAFLVEVDFQGRCIHMRLPEGLIDEAGE